MKRYGSPRQYLVLRAIRDTLLISRAYAEYWTSAIERQVEKELFALGWITVTPLPNGVRALTVTEAGTDAIEAYEENPNWSGILSEKRWLDGF